MNLNGPLKIAFVNSFVNLTPAEFEMSRLERATPIERGLVRGSPLRNSLLNNSAP